MDIDVERSTIGYAAATIALLAAVAFGLRPVFFDLSLTVRAAVILATFLVLLSVALYTGWSIDLLVLATFVGFVGYVLTSWPLGARAALGALLAVMATMAMAYMLHENRFRWSRRRAQTVVVLALVLTTATIAVDLQVGEVSYDRTVSDQAKVFPDQGRQMVVVGEATASTDSVYREPLDFPDVRACVYTAGGNTTSSVFYGGGTGTDGPQSVAPKGSITSDMEVPLTDEQAAAAGESIPVETAADCPDPAEVDGPRIVLADE